MKSVRIKVIIISVVTVTYYYGIIIVGILYLVKIVTKMFSVLQLVPPNFSLFTKFSPSPTCLVESININWIKLYKRESYFITIFPQKSLNWRVSKVFSCLHCVNGDKSLYRIPKKRYKILFLLEIYRFIFWQHYKY